MPSYAIKIIYKATSFAVSLNAILVPENDKIILNMLFQSLTILSSKACRKTQYNFVGLAPEELQ